jgi:hypothetical protein
MINCPSDFNIDKRMVLYKALYLFGSNRRRAASMRTEKASHLAYLYIAYRMPNSLYFKYPFQKIPLLSLRQQTLRLTRLCTCYAPIDTVGKSCSI